MYEAVDILESEINRFIKEKGLVDVAFEAGETCQFTSHEAEEDGFLFCDKDLMNGLHRFEHFICGRENVCTTEK